MKTPFDQHIALVELAIAEIISRPSFAVAMMWIRQSKPTRAKSGYPLSVGLFCFDLEHTWGAVVDKHTMALALENSGFKIAARAFVENNYELAVNIQRGSVNPSPWLTERPRPAFWAQFADKTPVPGAKNLYKNLLER